MKYMNKDEIKKLAHMARIKLSYKEAIKYADLNQILDTIAAINNVNTENIEPIGHPFNISQRLREDEVTEFNQRDILQTLAPNNIESGFYLVPEIFE